MDATQIIVQTAMNGMTRILFLTISYKIGCGQGIFVKIRSSDKRVYNMN